MASSKAVIKGGIHAYKNLLTYKITNQKALAPYKGLSRSLNFSFGRLGTIEAVPTYHLVTDTSIDVLNTSIDPDIFSCDTEISAKNIKLCLCSPVNWEEMISPRKEEKVP